MIPQFRDYFPFVVATSLAMALASWSLTSGMRGKVLLSLAVTVHLLFYSLAWSRMAIVMLAVVALVPLLVAWGSNVRLPRRYALVATAVLVAVPMTLVSRFGVFIPRLQTLDIEGSDNRRLEYALTATEMIAADLLFGRMFLPDWERDPFPARDLRVPRVYKSHNQYLDYGVRAGVPAMIILVAIMWLVACDLLYALRHASMVTGMRPLVIGTGCALIAASLGNLTLLLLVQAQSGSLAWLLVGLSVGMAESVRRAEGNAANERRKEDQAEDTDLDKGAPQRG